MRQRNRSLLGQILQLMDEFWEAQIVTQQADGKTRTGNRLPQGNL